MADLPEYVCALLTNSRDELVLQLRPVHARHAPDALTCFGGRREADETIVACLQRELREELGWNPPLPSQIDEHGIDLREGQRFIARFVPLHLPQGTPLRCEPGFHAIHCPLPALDGLPLSPWHRLVIRRWCSSPLPSTVWLKIAKVFRTDP